MKSEIKVWKTQTAEIYICRLLMMHGISFRYTEEEGIVFTAPEAFLKEMTRQIKTAYGYKKQLIFDEVK